jgi:hypothetical protein
MKQKEIIFTPNYTSDHPDTQKRGMSEGIELRVRAPRSTAVEDSERLLGEGGEEDYDEEGGVGAGVGLSPGEGDVDWERDHDDNDDETGTDLLRDIDSKRKKRNVAEPYYYQSQRKVPSSIHHFLFFIFYLIFE